MPHVRRGDRTAAAAPYRRGRATSGCRQRGRRRADDDEQIDGAVLPDDALAAVFSRFSDVGDVVRCAATCRRWLRIVTTRAGALARALLPPGRLLPRLAIGIFYQELDAPAARTRGSSASSSPPALPCFSPMASAARLADAVWHPLIRSQGDGLLRNSRPVASRNGRLVVELQQEAHSDGLRLCVCNPMSGDTAMLLPLLSGPPRDYGCALLTGDDDDDLSPLTSFHVLLLYNRRGFIALRCYHYSSGYGAGGGWGPEAKSSTTRISDGKLRRIGQAVVRRGVAFWPLDHGALGVRVSATAAEITPRDAPATVRRPPLLTGVSLAGSLAGRPALLCLLWYLRRYPHGEALLLRD
ncbi:unnamed protein product [Urochloa humidicola]